MDNIFYRKEEEIARNPDTSPDILRTILGKEKDNWVSRFAAGNPNCPPELLKMVLEKCEDNWVSWNAAENPNCPSDTLKMILEKRNNDDVSLYAARNPNCPPLERILWMRATGQIGVYDPSNPNHFIECEAPKVDEDLQKLRELASNA